jgi:DNA-binding GntR family transcriptional regulator
MSQQNDIYNRLKTAIIYGKLKPGRKLSEIECVKTFNVSRTPIREVFRQLQAEDYITVIANKGAYVRKIPPEEIDEVYDIVGMLEGRAAELAAKLISKSEIKELRKLQDKMNVIKTKNQYRDYFQINLLFHQRIRELSGNVTLSKLVTDLRARSIIRYQIILVAPTYMKKFISDHEKIVVALAKKDSARAKRCMMNHINHVRKIAVNFLKTDQNGLINSDLSGLDI